MFTLATGILGIQFIPTQQVSNHSPITVGFGQKIFTVGTVEASGTVDYVCDGINDNVQLQGALDALPANGGEIDILSGNYSFGATVTRAIPNVTIKGVGAATYISYNATNYIFTAGGNNWQISNLKVDTGSMDMGATTGWNWENVTVNTIYYAYRTSVSSSSWVIPTGRSSSWVIAAYNAPASVQSQADVVCTSTNFNTVLASAIAAGYRDIHLTEGTFGESATATILSNVQVTGSGGATLVLSNGNYPVFSIVGTNASAIYSFAIRSMVIEGSGKANTLCYGVSIIYGNHCWLEDLYITATYAGIYEQSCHAPYLSKIYIVGDGAQQNQYGILAVPQNPDNSSYKNELNATDILIGGVAANGVNMQRASGVLMTNVQVVNAVSDGFVFGGESIAGAVSEFVHLVNCQADYPIAQSVAGFVFTQGTSAAVFDGIQMSNPWVGGCKNAVIVGGNVTNVLISNPQFRRFSESAVVISGNKGTITGGSIRDWDYNSTSTYNGVWLNGVTGWVVNGVEFSDQYTPNKAIVESGSYNIITSNYAHSLGITSGGTGSVNANNLP